MGIELELYVLLALLTLDLSIFAVFEVEIPRWRKLLQWVIISTTTLGLYYAVGHLAILLPMVAGGAGTIVHFEWCRKHGIHPNYATPRRKYYDLRQWEWPG